MAKLKFETVSRSKIFKSEDFAALRENLLLANEMRGGEWNPMLPIRATPLQAMFAYKQKDGFRETILNPDLPRIWHEEFGVHIGDYSKGAAGGFKIVSLKQSYSWYELDH